MRYAPLRRPFFAGLLVGTLLATSIVAMTPGVAGDADRNERARVSLFVLLAGK